MRLMHFSHEPHPSALTGSRRTSYFPIPTTRDFKVFRMNACDDLYCRAATACPALNETLPSLLQVIFLTSSLDLYLVVA
jgi:hypothetical protein